VVQQPFQHGARSVAERNNFGERSRMLKRQDILSKRIGGPFCFYQLRQQRSGIYKAQYIYALHFFVAMGRLMRLALPTVVPVLFAVHVSGKAKPQFQAVIGRVGFAVLVLQYAALFQQFLRRFLKPLNGIMHRTGYLPGGGLQEKRAVNFVC
jgi:hypothetical protein